MVPLNVTKPIRNVIAFAVDEQHLKRPPQLMNDIPVPIEPIEFCVIKRSAISLYSLRERLFFQKVLSLRVSFYVLSLTRHPHLQEIPLPSGGVYARRTGKYLCVADKENYNVIDLVQASFVPLLPISQAPDPTIAVRPHITVISENEFLILSWTGASTLGVFVTGDGDPVRGTLEWPSHPETVCAYPFSHTCCPQNSPTRINSARLSLYHNITPERNDRDPQRRDPEHRSGNLRAGGYAVAACG